MTPEALKRAMLERQVKARKLLENIKRGEMSGSLDDIELKPGGICRIPCPCL